MNFQQSPNARQRSNTIPRTSTPELYHSGSDYKPRLLTEIEMLMRSSGDSVSSQNRDSIILVEKIVIQQLRGILNEAMNVAYNRTGNVIPKQEDFEFLMRKNQSKKKTIPQAHEKRSALEGGTEARIRNQFSQSISRGER